MNKFGLIKSHVPKIEDVETPEGMTAPEVLYALNIVQGYRYQEAYRRAIGARAKGKTGQQLSRGAYKFKNKPLIQKYIREIMREIERAAVLSSLELQTFLSAVVYTPVGHVDEFSPLCQEKTVIETTSKDGAITKQTKTKMPNKHACSQLLARIRGFESPIKVEHNHRVGVMVVPMAASVEDWERLAAGAQQRLMQDAIDLD